MICGSIYRVSQGQAGPGTHLRWPVNRATRSQQQPICPYCPPMPVKSPRATEPSGKGKGPANGNPPQRSRRRRGRVVGSTRAVVVVMGRSVGSPTGATTAGLWTAIRQLAAHIQRSLMATRIRAWFIPAETVISLFNHYV